MIDVSADATAAVVVMLTSDLFVDDVTISAGDVCPAVVCSELSLLVDSIVVVVVDAGVGVVVVVVVVVVVDVLTAVVSVDN